MSSRWQSIVTQILSRTSVVILSPFPSLAVEAELIPVLSRRSLFQVFVNQHFPEFVIAGAHSLILLRKSQSNRQKLFFYLVNCHFLLYSFFSGKESAPMNTIRFVCILFILTRSPLVCNILHIGLDIRQILYFLQIKMTGQREFVPLPGHGVLEEIKVSKSVVLEKC